MYRLEIVSGRVIPDVKAPSDDKRIGGERLTEGKK
jgi:hypothetical protein